MMGILKAYPVLAAGLFYIYYYDREQTGLDSAVPLIKTRSLFLTPWICASLMTCFDQKNVVKAMFGEISSSAFEAIASSAFLVL